MIREHFGKCVGFFLGGGEVWFLFIIIWIWRFEFGAGRSVLVDLFFLLQWVLLLRVDVVVAAVLEWTFSFREKRPPGVWHG